MKTLAAWFLTLPAMALAQQTAIHVFPIPAAISAPGYMIPGPQKSVWFTDGPQIGRITPSGEITQFPTPPPWDVSSITTGPDGATWFIPANGNAIGRMTTNGVVTEYPLPEAGDPSAIAAGSDGALWFTDYGLNAIGRITTSGVVSYYVVPTPQAGVAAIAKGPDGALWFLEEFGNNIGRVTTNGAVTEYPLPAPNGGLYCCITQGSDGAMWFDVPGFFTPSFIGRITKTGEITEFPLSDPPQGITPGPDGALWFISNAGIGRITTTGAVSYLPGGGGAITQGPTHELWLTGAVGTGGVYTPGVIEEMVFETATLTVSPDTGPPGETLQFTGSGFVPNETVQIYTGGVGSRVMAAATADSSGAISVSTEAPESPYLFGDTSAFLGAGQTSGNLGAAPFTSTSRLKVNPSSGAAGSTVTLTGYGFGPFEFLDIFWVNSSTLLGNVTATVNGTFDGSAALQFTVPSDAAPGVYLLKAYGRYAGNGAHIEFTVE
jgi:virginiamycin B lyase